MTMHCPITGVNIARFIPTILAGFIFLFGYEFILHNHLLLDMYEETEVLWRFPEEMQDLFPFMIFMQIALTLVSALIFTRHYEGKGLGEGLRFGLLLGLLLGVMMASPYFWLPISCALAAAWFAGGLGMGLGMGIIFSLIYRK